MSFAGKGGMPSSRDIVLARNTHNEPTAVAQVRAFGEDGAVEGFVTTVKINGQELEEWWRFVDQTEPDPSKLCDAQETLAMLEAAARDPLLNPDFHRRAA